MADIDLRNYTVGTGGAPALDDITPSCWSPNILSDGDATTGEVGKFFDLKNQGSSVSQMTKLGSLAIAGMLSIGATLFGVTSIGLKNNSAVAQVVFGNDSGLAPFEAKSLKSTMGTITASTPSLDLSQTWNAVGTTFKAITLAITGNSASASGSLFLEFTLDGSQQVTIGKQGNYVSNGTAQFGGNQVYIRATSGSSTGAVWVPGGNTNSFFGFTTNTTAGSASTMSAIMYRVAAGIVGFRGASSTAGGGINFLEQSDPTAPGADQVNVYAKDNGSGKTQLVAQFNTGAVQVIATQP